MNRSAITTIAKAALVATASVLAARSAGKLLEEWRDFMGVVADVLNGVNAQLVKAKGEIVGKLDDLKTQLDAKGNLDAEDAAAIEALKGNAGDLDNIVPDAVTVPLPDPETPPTDGGSDSDPVIDPSNPVEDVPAPDAPVQAPEDGTVPPVDSATDPAPVEVPVVDETPAVETPAEVVTDPATGSEGDVSSTDGTTADAIASGDPIPDPAADETNG